MKIAIIGTCPKLPIVSCKDFGPLRVKWLQFSKHLGHNQEPHKWPLAKEEDRQQGECKMGVKCMELGHAFY
jgi:hypothetical protein